MVEALGGRTKGIRIVARVPEVTGELAKVTARIAELGGNIVSLAIFLDKDAQHREITMKVQGIPQDAVVATLEGTGAKVIDVREITAELQPQVIPER
jgi:acetoin utilization protein AcuB